MLDSAVVEAADERRSLLLGVVLGALATLLVVVGVGGSPDEQRAGPRAPTTTTGVTPQTRSTFHGRLLGFDAKTVTIEQPDGVHVLPLQPDTSICRTSCRDLWQDLRVGDDVLAGVTKIGTVTLTQWVEANPTAGWVAVDAVDGDRLTVRWGKAAASQEPFTVVVGPNTRWNTESRGPELVCPGAQLHLVGGQHAPGIVSAWTLSPGRPSPSCSA